MIPSTIERYQVFGELGEGGMSRVYLAEERDTQRTVVLKVPHCNHITFELLERFHREVQSTIALAHPHIVRVLDAGVWSNMPFVALEYLPGGSLLDRVQSDYQPGPQRLGLAQLRDWLPPIAQALDFVHSRGFVHRDVKPGNILFDRYDRAFLGDFGITKAVLADLASHENAAMTRTGMVLGTAEYISPEAVAGHDLDGRADQYSLGVLLYELLAGRRPFVAPTASALLVLHVTQDPPSLRAVAPYVSPQACTAIDRALSKRPEARYASCSGFVAAVLEGVHETAALPPPRERRLRDVAGQILTPTESDSSIPTVADSEAPSWLRATFGLGSAFVMALACAVLYCSLPASTKPPKSAQSAPSALTAMVESSESPSMSAEQPVVFAWKDIPPQKLTERETWILRLDAFVFTNDPASATYKLLYGPDGLTLDDDAMQLTWRPTEKQGPGTYQAAIRVGVGGEGAVAQITLDVAESNEPPHILVSGSDAAIRVTAGSSFTYQVRAYDPDYPPNALQFDLVDGAEGANIDAHTGLLSWEIPKEHEPVSRTLEFSVRDNGTPPLAVEGKLTLQIIAPPKREDDVPGTKDSAIAEKDALTPNTRTFAAGDAKIQHVGFLRSGSTFFSIGSVVRVRDAQTGRVLTTFQIPDAFGTIRAVSTSPDDSHLLLATDRMHLSVWNLSTGRCVYSSTANGRSAPLDVELFGNGHVFYVGCGGITGIDLRSGAYFLRIAPVSGRPVSVNWCTCGSISREGRLAITGGQSAVSIWDVTKLDDRFNPPRATLLGTLPTMTKVAQVDFVLNGRVIIARMEGGQIAFWDLQANRRVSLFGGDLSGVGYEISDDGTKLVVHKDDRMNVYDLLNKQPIVDVLHGDSAPGRVALSPRGRQLLIYNPDRNEITLFSLTE